MLIQEKQSGLTVTAAGVGPIGVPRKSRVMLTSSYSKGVRNDLRTPWASDKLIVGGELPQLQGMSRGIEACGTVGDPMLWGIHL